MENNGEYAVHTIWRSPNTDSKKMIGFEEELCEFLSAGYAVVGAGLDGYTVYAIVTKKLVSSVQEASIESYGFNGE